MAGFERNSSGLALLGSVPLSQLFDEAPFRTPCYVYDVDGIAENARSLVQSLGPGNLAAYAMKANSAATILRTMAEAGTGADVVSGAELELALACGIDPNRVVMSGVAKTDSEIDQAILAGILALQVESVEELERIATRAQQLGKAAPVTPRVNPSVNIDSHAKIATGHDDAKFGILRADLPRAWALIDQTPWLTATGISCHVGSMLREEQAYIAAAQVVCSIALERRARGFKPLYVSFGGGFGIDYGAGAVPTPAQFATAALDLLKAQGLGDVRLCVEPGRSMVGPYAVLAAKVIQTKRTARARWLMVDAGMNDLLRPALYQAVHRVEALDTAPHGEPWRVVGPVCESSDDFGTHMVSEAPPTLVVFRDAGAYGYVMASEYNGRPLPAEVFLAGGQVAHVSAPANCDRWLKERLGA